MTDILVIGGGTAGLTAAVYARRSGKSVIVLEKESTGGQIVFSPKIENYPGLPGISGADYASALTGQAEDLGAVIEYDEALSVRQEGERFIVMGETGEWSAKALILAPGTSHRRLGVEMEEELVGCGVSYCAVCDGAFYAGREAAVLGGGNTALTDALFLSGVCSKVTVIHRRAEFRGEDALVSRLRQKPNVEFLLDSTVIGLCQQEDILTGIRVKNLKTQQEKILPTEGLFIAIGQVPQTEAFRGFVDMDGAGYITAAEDCRTSRPGVFTAGDCRTKTVRQLTTAAADGAAAGLGACSYIDGI